MSDFKYAVEYAKTGRAGCKVCKGKIPKDSLRVARMVKSPFHDGLDAAWHDFECFFDKKKGFGASKGEQFRGFSDIRWEDQERIKKALGSKPPMDGGAELVMELAKSSRSECRNCEENILKGELRLGVMMEANADSSFQGMRPWWYHRKCFAKSLSAHENVTLSQVMAVHFEGQDKVDKELRDDVDRLLDDARESAGLAKLSGSISNKGKKATKAKQETDKATKKVKTSPEEEALKHQSGLLWKVRDGLSNVSNGTLKFFLEKNGQDSSGGQQTLLERIADTVIFGPLDFCSDCGNKEWQLKPDGYHCQGYISSDLPCTIVTKTPPRKKKVNLAALSDDVAKKLKKLKPGTHQRVFQAITIPAKPAKAAKSTASAANQDNDDDDDVKPKIRGPLHGVKVAIAGSLLQSKAQTKALIEKLGGTLVSGSLGSHVTCVLSTTKTVDKGTTRAITDAKKFGLPIVSESFLTETEKTGKCAMLQKHLIMCTSTVVEPAQEQSNTERLIEKKRKRKNEDNGGKVTVIVKGRCAVDPGSGVQDTHHVLDEGHTIWNCILSLVNLRDNANSYYKMQILVDDASNRKVFLYRAWGRTGTGRGSSLLDQMSLNGAKDKFEEIYLQKTGNAFGAKTFIPKPKHFTALDIDYGDFAEKDKKIKYTKLVCKLDPRVQKLVETICDLDLMKKTMVSMDIDVTKLPLGKLSRKHLEGALEVLTKLQDVLEKDEQDEDAKRKDILSTSTQFYRMIPHDFGNNEPVLIDNLKLLKEKSRLVEDLLEMEVAASLLKTETPDEQHPVDCHYERLKCKIEPLDKAAKEYKLLHKYLHNTHASTHSHYTLEIDEMYSVQRNGELERFKKFESLHNKRLLWHGSRVTNFVGILSEGLRIAPPSAPITGYMYGKGVYFADMVSKSANYCFANASNPTGLLILSEVALGTPLALTTAKYIDKLPKGKHHTWGKGQTGPDPSDIATDENGVAIPFGKPVKTGVKGSSLLYNEYIVYDTAQIKMRYLLKVRFKFKTRY